MSLYRIISTFSLGLVYSPIDKDYILISDLSRQPWNHLISNNLFFMSVICLFFLKAFIESKEDHFLVFSFSPVLVLHVNVTFYWGSYPPACHESSGILIQFIMTVVTTFLAPPHLGNVQIALIGKIP